MATLMVRRVCLISCFLFVWVSAVNAVANPLFGTWVAENPHAQVISIEIDEEKISFDCPRGCAGMVKVEEFDEIEISSYFVSRQVDHSLFVPYELGDDDLFVFHLSSDDILTIYEGGKDDPIASLTRSDEYQLFQHIPSCDMDLPFGVWVHKHGYDGQVRLELTNSHAASHFTVRAEDWSAEDRWERVITYLCPLNASSDLTYFIVIDGQSNPKRLQLLPSGELRVFSGGRQTGRRYVKSSQ